MCTLGKIKIVSGPSSNGKDRLAGRLHGYDRFGVGCCNHKIMKRGGGGTQECIFSQKIIIFP